MSSTHPSTHPQVGAPDPERDTSPIVGEDDELEVEPNVRGGGCTFNGVGYGIGDLVLSGSELLRCEAPGVWVREGEMRPTSGKRPGPRASGPRSA